MIPISTATTLRKNLIAPGVVKFESSAFLDTLPSNS
jgi:hypothetical protein